MPSNDTTALGRTIFTSHLLGVALAVSVLLLAFAGGQASALTEADEPETTTTQPSAEDEAEAEQLREGATVYSQVCASCHQAGGTGLEGQFPPLIDNSNVDDAAYLETVITNGRQGELEVAGVAYDGVMPSFSTLSDDDTGAVIAFIQNDFVAPAVAAIPSVGSIDATEPAVSNTVYFLASVIVAALIALVFARRIIGETDRLNMPWLDAWLKTAVIVSGVILLVVVVPNWVIRNENVTKLSRFSQDLIGVSVWGLGLGLVFWSLWYAHRKSRI